MEEFNEKATTGFRIKLLLFHRFLDDTFFIWTGTADEQQEFGVYLNGLIEGMRHPELINCFGGFPRHHVWYTNLQMLDMTHNSRRFSLNQRIPTKFYMEHPSTHVTRPRVS